MRTIRVMGKVVMFVEWIKNHESNIKYENIVNILKNEGWEEFEREDVEDGDRIWRSVSMKRNF